MIDCEVKFGAYVPTVPKIYQDAAAAPEVKSRTDFEKEIQKCSDCFIGPAWMSLKLIEIEPYNNDTSLFTFALPEPDAHLNLPVTAHLLIKGYDDNTDDGSGNGNGNPHVRPYTAVREQTPGQFTVMVKRYREWGIPERVQRQNNKFFLYARTDHSYKPPGMVSNYVHNLNIGQTLSFMHNEHCLGKMDYPLPKDITSITMIAVGAGIAPMFRIIRALLDSNQKCEHVANIRLLYGARTVSDILLREQLDQWHDSYDSNCNGNNDNDDSKKRFQVCYCIGSRWNNIHFHAKSNDQRQGPPLPKDWDTVPDDRKELGWVDGDKVQRRSASTADDPGHRIFICGLPGVYLKLAGSRFNTQVEEGTQLYKLGYRDHQVVKF